MRMNTESSAMKVLKKIGFEGAAWSLRRIHCPVDKTALVLEVGAGGNPYPRANVLLAIQNGTLKMQRDNFDKAVGATIENIQSMEALCGKRKIKFVLVTQKLFAVDNPYYKFMDPYVLKAVEELKKSKQLSGIQLIEMQKEFPDSWNAGLINKVKNEFPDAVLNFDQGLAYDNMHFSPAGLHLFATILADRMSMPGLAHSAAH